MKELTLSEVKAVSLDILKDVHDFCIAHDIKYSLAYGTLIGAIRHKGFIPWDDDIDIVMPRPDFERFFKEYKSEKGYNCLSPESNESWIAFGRVYDNQNTKVETTAPWCSFETGLWIDIFPLDGAESTEDDFLNRVRCLKPIATKIAMMRTSDQGFWETKTLRRKCTWIIKKLYTFGCSLLNLKNKYNQMIYALGYEYCDSICQLAFFDSQTVKEYYQKEDFKYYIDVEFEGHVLKAMKGYDRVLRHYYGDYMQLPPEKERTPKQSSYLHFYWKNGFEKK